MPASSTGVDFVASIGTFPGTCRSCQSCRTRSGSKKEVEPPIFGDNTRRPTLINLTCQNCGADLDRQYGTVTDTASLLGVTERTVERHLASGRLSAERVAGRRIIRLRDAEALRTPEKTSAA